MEYEIALTLCFAGALAGLLVGLIGSGIGPIVVPLMIFILPLEGIPQEICIRMAIATSLTIILVTTSISSLFHWKNCTINKKLFWSLLPGSLCGAIIGGIIVIFLKISILKFVFSILLLLLGMKLLIKNNRRKKAIIHTKPSHMKNFFSSGFIAIISNMLGISDGVLMVPFLEKCCSNMLECVGTATILIIPVSFVGLIPLMVTSIGIKNLPIENIGYISVSALLFIAIPSILFSIIGIQLAKKINENIIRIIFSSFVIITGFRMLFH